MFKSSRSLPIPLKPHFEYVAVAPQAIYPHKINPELRVAIKSAWKNRCAYCRTGAVEHVDHVFPTSRGGPDCLANYVGACGPCNSRKSDHILPDTLLVFLVEEAKRKVPAVQLALQRILDLSNKKPRPPRKPLFGWHDVKLPFSRSQVARLLSLDAMHEGKIPLSDVGEEIRSGIVEANSHGIAVGIFADKLCFKIEDGILEATDELIELLMTSLACSSKNFRIRTKKYWSQSGAEIEEGSICEKYEPILFSAPLSKYEVLQLYSLITPAPEVGHAVLSSQDAGYLTDIVKRAEQYGNAIFTTDRKKSFPIIESRNAVFCGRWGKRIEIHPHPLAVRILKKSLEISSPSFISFLDKRHDYLHNLLDKPSVKVRPIWEEKIDSSWSDIKLTEDIFNKNILSNDYGERTFAFSSQEDDLDMPIPS